MPTLTPHDFVSKWKRAEARERQSVQEHFIDLCRLVGHETPMQADPTGKRYAFEMGAAKTSGGTGWADVAKLGYFGWEYKGKHADLDKAYDQLLRYRDALQNPPLLIVSDINNIVIRTNFTNFPTRTIALTLDDLLKPESIKILKAVFFNPEELKPQVTVEGVTREAASQFSRLADNLRKYEHNNQEIAHFLIRLLFCLFAEDIGLLPEKLFPRLLAQTRRNSRDFAEVLSQLFSAMKTGGYFGADKILYFNGGLFDDNRGLPLDGTDMDIIGAIDALDWGAIEPSIFGTLFERGLDPSKRSQLGAHYTSKEDILLIVEPVLMAPLRREWARVQADCRELKNSIADLTSKKRASVMDEISRKLRGFADKIAAVKVLDPACGSGNFLYVALRLLLDLQNEVFNFSDEMGAGRPYITVTPSQLYGIETNEYAYELAQMTIQIGYIQWLRDNGYGFPQEPILRQVNNIMHMDALLAFAENDKPIEPRWPEVDVIVGNPPFLGGNKIRAELGNAYVDNLFKLYEGRVPAFADLVCYWFERARAMIDEGKVQRVGLLATQAIRGGVNRRVLERIKETGDIFWAYSDRNWILNGAAVHVSMIGFDNKSEDHKSLDNKTVQSINPDLTSQSDLTTAQPLIENANICFYGSQQKGSFDITAAQAKQFLSLPNPFGLNTSDVVKRSLNGSQILRRGEETWVIDFGTNMPLEKAAMYEAPFEYVKRVVYPERKDRNEKIQREYWWLHARPSPRYREILRSQKRYIASPTTAKHRLFIWLDTSVLADHAVVVYAREDDYFFGVLQSKVHEIWARRQGTQLREAESGSRYTPSTSFETFPFPWPPGQEPIEDLRVQAIANAAKELVEQRDRWLNAESLSEAEQKRRTLTGLYNKRPTWLDLAHKRLDDTVFMAYGWKSDMTDEEILTKLLELNLERSQSKH